MKELLKQYLEQVRGSSLPEHSDIAPSATGSSDDEAELKVQVTALYSLLASIFGSERLVLRAGKLEALGLMRSESLEERVLGLQRLLFADPSMTLPEREKIPELIAEIEVEIAELLTRKAVEDRLDKLVTEKMAERQTEYMREVKLALLKDEAGVETEASLRKLEELEAINKRKAPKAASEQLRPQRLGEVVGQERAVKALMAKLATPFPQHVILYGPPGVGKTTAARLVLSEAAKLPFAPFGGEAPFIEVDGSTLRWDPRETTNPLLGSVHDPIYQGARRDLAESAIPEPKPGLVTEAHGGILFIDEIGEMDPILQAKLLKVLEDKRVSFDSAYYDSEDPHVPQYIRKLFSEGAPANFVLIGATTRDPEEINPAIRSRCAEVFFDPLSPEDIRAITVSAAKRLKVSLEPGVEQLIADYTIEGRKAVNILADAYGLALHGQSGKVDRRRKLSVTKDHVLEVIQISRLAPNALLKASAPEIGKVLGLGVQGYMGSVLEIEAVAFPAREEGKGQMRFNDTAGSMTKDSLFNAASVIRKLYDIDLSDYDIHVNVVGGGQIDGPSAGVAIVTALVSAIRQQPVDLHAAVTGEVSIQGMVKAVGGLYAKLYGAKQAGLTRVLIPQENAQDVPAGLLGLEIIPVTTVEEALGYLLQTAIMAKVG